MANQSFSTLEMAKDDDVLIDRSFVSYGPAMERIIRGKTSMEGK
jgi:hypothetical protein